MNQRTAAGLEHATDSGHQWPKSMRKSQFTICQIMSQIVDGWNKISLCFSLSRKLYACGDLILAGTVLTGLQDGRSPNLRSWTLPRVMKTRNKSVKALSTYLWRLDSPSKAALMQQPHHELQPVIWNHHQLHSQITDCNRPRVHE